MKTQTTLLLLLILCSSCGVKHIGSDVAASALPSCRKEVLQMNEVSLQDAGQTMQAQPQLIPVKKTTTGSVTTSSSAAPTFHPVVKTKMVKAFLPQQKRKGNDPPDGHVLLILFYLFVGTMLFFWGGGIVVAGIFASSFIGVLFGLLLMTLGLMPIFGLITMLSGSRKRPHYSEK